VIFLVIILVSPGGLMGIWESLVRRLVKPQPVAAIAVPAPSDSHADGGHVGRPGT